MEKLLYFVLKSFSCIQNVFGLPSVDFSTNILTINRWKKIYCYFVTIVLLFGMVLDIYETLKSNRNTIAVHFIAIYVVECIAAVTAVQTENNYKIPDKVKTFNNIMEIDESLCINKKQYSLLLWRIVYQNILYSVLTVFMMIFDVWVWEYFIAELVLFIRTICIEISSIQLSFMVQTNTFYLEQLNENLKVLCKRRTITTKICSTKFNETENKTVNIFLLMTLYDKLADNMCTIMDRMKFMVKVIFFFNI